MSRVRCPRVRVRHGGLYVRIVCRDVRVFLLGSAVFPFVRYRYLFYTYWGVRIGYDCLGTDAVKTVRREKGATLKHSTIALRPA